MGAIWLDGEQLREFLTEFVGTKLGLTIDDDGLDAFFAARDVPANSKNAGGLMRMRSEEVEELARVCLQHFGDPDAAHVGGSPLITVSVLQAFDDFPQALDVVSYAIAELGAKAKGGSEAPIKVDDILKAAEERWGLRGRQVAEHLLQEVNARLLVSPWTDIARTEYRTRIELRDLFTSRSLPSAVQQFFDQRFIDYLDANGNDITQMHWRQFEGLVAEGLVQAGFRVEIGPGSNDEGVDVRAWDPNQPEEQPALLLVQCKRERKKVNKVVVKALAADVSFEGSRVGLVATTSSWSPGARETVRARKYPLIEADGDNIREWIKAMRSPSTGPWLAG